MGEGDSGGPYGGPAGGWGALSASVRQLFRKKALLRGGRALLRMNQDKGFDCPGCAWPEPERRTSFEFCENGVKAAAEESTGRRVTASLFQRYTVSELNERSNRWLEDQGRLTEPLVYDPETDRYVAVSWEVAFTRIGAALRALDSPDHALFYPSGRTSNEAAFLYQLFCREYGTNNLPDCANMCHESSGKALAQVVGVGKGTVTLKDFEEADAIFVWGQNPGTNHPRMLTELQKASKRGAQIVAINPLKERGLERFLHPQHAGAMLTGRSTPISTLYLQPVLGGDMALIKGMVKCVLDAEDSRGDVVDHTFIEAHTQGYEAMSQDARATSWELITAQSGLSREEIQRAADVFIGSDRVITCWAMGLTQHRHAVPTLQTLVNLMLMRGQLGKAGAGLCPVRGHSNVQGDRTMGITPWPKTTFLDGLKRVFGFEPPREHGLDVMGAIDAMSDGPPRIFFALGGNFVAATPDTDHVTAAVERCAMTVQVSTKLNRSHLVHGQEAYILPCLSRSETDVQGGRVQRVTVEDSMSMVHTSQGRLPPAGDALLSEPVIVSRLAQATLPDSVVPWAELVEDYDRIR
ncbi:MAG: FdhF/YdeP family oxidoreductase, partial [Myxococcota bacterium]|nr:FdhF/YdeP family oxidoreductase [Myxococcota bacterium]